jgi:tRNA threonylcarbamoyladenosine biosynthesis protein TsaB
MLVLSFDTSMSACSAALYDGARDEILCSRHEQMQRGQAERLVPLLNEILDDSGHTFQDIGLITCCRGPGAFTGLRIALATAKALSLALDIPALGISTLEAVAATHCAQREREKPFLVALETKRKDYYVQFFHKDGSAAASPASSPLEIVKQGILDHAPEILTGDAAERLKTDITENKNKLYVDNITYPNTSILAKLAFNKYKSITNKEKKLHDMRPLYLRDADVSVPKSK